MKSDYELTMGILETTIMMDCDINSLRYTADYFLRKILLDAYHAQLKIGRKLLGIKPENEDEIPKEILFALVKYRVMLNSISSLDELRGFILFLNQNIKVRQEALNSILNIQV